MKNNILVKSIILSLITISLTACGGGGGGGGSNGNVTPTPPNIIPEPDENGNITDTVVINKDNITLNIPIKIESNSNKTGVLINNNGVITLNNNIELKDSNGINENNYTLIGVEANSGAEIRNLGKLKIETKGNAIGFNLKNSDLINNGEINISVPKDKLGIGIKASGDSKVVNNEQISGKGNVIGIETSNGAIASNNYSEIKRNSIELTSVDGSSVTGMKALSSSTAINNGMININGQGYGMYADGNSKIQNNGTININGQGYGMYAKGGSYALNEGVINLSSQANGGMVADGNESIVENKGTINVDSNSSLTKDKIVTAINGGKVLNSGDIIFKDKATIYSVDGLYTIGTSQDGSYGKVVAENIEIDGNVAIDSGISKGSYKDTYILEGVFEGEVEFGDEYKVVSDSLLYDVNIVQGGNGNYDGKLVRNDKVISDFTGKDYTQTAKLFDKYFSENEYNSLNEAGKNLIDSINIEDENVLKKNIKDLTPTLYANNSRIISEIGDSFKGQREKTILSLEEYDYNFSFIGNIMAVDSEEIIEGYDSQMTGFVGTMKLSDEKYLSLGYGYSDIDYDGDSEGNIHSIHLGVDNYKKYGALNLQYGFGGEYNFHKIDREMRSYNTKGESDFDSYGVKAYGKILKSYKSVVEIEPFISLGLGYYHVDNISEKSNVTINVAEEDYLSIKPELGFDIAKKYDTIKLYGGVAYSYELGDMDKRVAYSYEGIVENNEIKDNQENGLLTTKIGVNFIKNSFTFGVEGGKNFGKRDNSFISGNIGYRF